MRKDAAARCGNCPYFADTLGPETKGECRRHSPIVFNLGEQYGDPILTVFPERLNNDDACGDHPNFFECGPDLEGADLARLDELAKVAAPKPEHPFCSCCGRMIASNEDAGDGKCVWCSAPAYGERTMEKEFCRDCGVLLTPKLKPEAGLCEGCQIERLL